jgi:hypothetical protein
MPQRDDRISRRTGILPEHLWSRLGPSPGRRCEEALSNYFTAWNRKEALPSFPAPVLRGKRRTIWLAPDVSAELDRVADAAGVTFTAVLLAALRYEYGEEAVEPDPGDDGTPPRRPGPQRRRLIKAACRTPIAF